MNSKNLWNKLAKVNSKYYIYSTKGRDVSDKEFWKSGKEDFTNLIWNDDLIKPSDTILEIGCGNGRMTEFMVTQFNKVIGIDISGEMINQARKRIPYENIQFIETDGVTFPLKDNSIDIAFSYLVFQHMKSKEIIESNFREVYRVLKKNGIFKVRVRTDIVTLRSWWGGVATDESYPLSIGFKLLKKEPISFYGQWLWLQK